MNGKRKFIVTIFFGTCCFALCAYGRMSSGDTMAAVGILSGLYKASNVIDKRLGGAG